MVRDLHYKVITQTGFTTADEMLYPENLPLIDDLVSYIAVGARSVEDQQHRFVASGCDAPVGMKNPTSGNPLAYAILRGGLDENGKNHPNYHTDDLLDTIALYEKMNLKNPFIVIDTNHDNSGKKFMEQVRIVRQTLINRDWDEKIRKYVRGFMIESYLEDGRQDKPETFGQSITDPCLGWDKTVDLIQEIYKNEQKVQGK